MGFRGAVAGGGGGGGAQAGPGKLLALPWRSPPCRHTPHCSTGSSLWLGSLRSTGFCSESESRYLSCPLQTSRGFQGRTKRRVKTSRILKPSQ